MLFVFLLLSPDLAFAIDDAVAFQQFLEWYKSYKGSPFPNEIDKAYAAELAAKGLSDADALARREAVRRIAATLPREFVALNFNKIYGMEAPPFRTEASAFLARLVEDVPPGKALDVAMGQGRNALYLASKGWDVTGYDLSDGGLARARAAADKAGLKLQTVLSSHEDFDYGQNKWDLIVETYAFTDLKSETYRKRVLDALKPGGMLLIEGFGNAEGDDAMLRSFPGTRVVAYENRTDVADWSLRKAPLERIAVRKK